MRFTDGPSAVGDGVPAAGGAVEAPPAAPDPVTPDPAAVSEPASSGNPWDADLRSALEGAEDPFTAASEFIGKNIQPRVTQLEQDLAARPENIPPEAVELYQDLLKDPDEVIATIFRGRYGDEVANKALALLDQDPDAPNLQDIVDEQDGEIPLEKLPPEVQEAVRKQEALDAQKDYDEMLADIKAQEGRENLDEIEFAKQLVLTEGDVELALANLDAEQAKYEKAFREKYNITDDVEVPKAPPTINSNTTTPAQPEPPKAYTSWDQLDEAFDDMAAETRTGTPPPVGTV